jgi:large subunit ribosomal protein L17
MNKRVFGRKLSRSRPSREALFASLAQSLIINGKIVTTRAKAKAVQGSVEKMVTLAKSGSIASRRKVMSNLDNKRETYFISESCQGFYGQKFRVYQNNFSSEARRGQCPNGQDGMDEKS